MVHNRTTNLRISRAIFLGGIALALQLLERIRCDRRLKIARRPASRSETNRIVIDDD